MPYWIYKSWLFQNFFPSRKTLRILEIGVDTGAMLLPLVQKLTEGNYHFHITAVDVRRDENVAKNLEHWEQQIALLGIRNKKIDYLIENSLEWLPKCEDQFDLMLIDGDHNYHTVQEELKHLDRLLKEDGIALVDDFNGKWSQRDLFYSTRETHEGVENMTEAVDTEKHGVQPAVLDFLKENQGWAKVEPVQSESVVITRTETAKALFA